MGRLDRLELENFKSYGGVQVIGPFADFTCIVGPNGAGKSNLMDAISFVLGVQSRQLRSANLKELVFRKDANSTPARTASVRLYYVTSESEDIPGITPGMTVVFSRSISSSGVSSYRFNEKEVSFEGYEKILSSIGVLVKARNFLVFQGDVESIAAKNPTELTRLLEHICGSDALTEEFEDLKQRKAAAEEATMFTMQKKRMFVSQCKEVRAQKEEAEAYQRQQATLSTVRSDHIVWNLYHLVVEMEGHESTITEAKESVGELAEEETGSASEVANLKKRLAKLTSTLLNLEKDCQSHQKQSSKTEAKLSTIRSRGKALFKRISDIEKQEERVNEDLSEQKRRIESLSKDLANAERRLTNARNELEQHDSGNLQMNEEQLEQYREMKEKTASRTAADRARLVTIDLETTSLNQQRTVNSTNLTALRSEIEGSMRLISDMEARVKTLETSVESDKTRLTSLTREKDRLAAALAADHEEYKAVSEELVTVAEKLRNAGDERRRHKADQKLVDAIKTMMAVFKGVHGKLVDLCQPIQKKYATAVSVSAGKMMDAVVVDSKAVATECITYLKEHRVGVCTFIPLDGIPNRGVPERLRSFGAAYKPCIDLVECADFVKPAVAFAVDNAVVCDTLAHAQTLCFERQEMVKAVTLQGHVISRNGAMTGGSLRDANPNRWEERDLEALRQRRKVLEDRQIALGDTVNQRTAVLEAEEQIRRVSTKIQYSEVDLQTTREKGLEMVKQNALREARAAEMTKKDTDITERLHALETERTETTKRIHDTEVSILEPLSSQMGIPDLLRYEENAAQRHTELLERFNSLSKEVAALTASLEYAQQQDFESVLARLGEERLAAVNEYDALEAQEKEVVHRSGELKRLLATAIEAQEAASKERDELMQEMKSHVAEKSETASRRDAFLKTVAAEEIAMERIRTEIEDLLQRARVEEIDLPLTVTMGDEDSLTATEKLLMLRDGEYVDLSKARRKYKGDLTKSRITAIESEFTRKIADLTAQLEIMQPNLHAAERFDGVMEKVKDCSDSLEACKDDVRAISAEFERVRKQRLALFTDCFSHVSSTLGAIYKDLTRSSKHPLGGNAYLTLDNTEEPFAGGIRFTAMPPMKRFRDMEHLSGGEKTVAALALLFAIHSFRQAPFFVLDEVDAALDNVNVSKICNYIRQRSRDFQCIVISLKDIFFERADALVGVCRDIPTGSSQTITLDLLKYPEEGTTAEVEEDPALEAQEV